jgi:hypothetical protein
MGIPTWIVIPILPYYLWAKQGPKTEWYDSVTLFRQETYGDWGETFRKIKKQFESIGGEMPTVKTGYWIRVKNGSVIEVWDYAPPVEEIEAGVGWCEAVEIFPDLIENRETITTHTINIDKSPAEIVWSKRDITVDERKSLLIRLAKGNFQEVVDDEAC